MLIAGYFDWFSGYQETALAAALATMADTEIIASDRVSPAFSDEHLKRIGIERRYKVGTSLENGVSITRFSTRELRSMVWSRDVLTYVGQHRYDLVVQVMPGQLLSAAPSLTRSTAPRVVLYGDNKAMWSHLNLFARLAKGAAFAVSKGLLYTIVNARSVRTYGYTPNTIARLRPFTWHRMHLMPLAFSPERFHYDSQLRGVVRDRLGFADDHQVIVAAGKIEDRKRLDWLVNAFGNMADSRPTTRLLIVGTDGGAPSDRLRLRVESSPRAKHITLLPFTDAKGLNELFNAADLGVWPRNPAITIQQAMGTGLPVVLPRNDLVGHLVKGDSGIYFELDGSDDSRAVEDALEKAMTTLTFSEARRRLRVQVNSWLSAENISRDLLTLAERDQ